MEKNPLCNDENCPKTSMEFNNFIYVKENLKKITFRNK